MALPPWVLVVVVAFSSSVLFKLMSRAFTRKLNLPPSPPRLPLIGNLHQLASPLHCTLSRLARQYGPVMLLHKGSVPLLVVSSAEMAKKVLVEQSMAFSSRVGTTRAKIIFSGRTAISFAPYGEDWRKMRNACISGLVSPKKVQSLKPARDAEIAALIENLSQSHTVNLSDLLLDFSYNVISRCVTGRDNDREDVRRFGELLKTLFVQVLPESFFVEDFFPWLGWVDAVSGARGKLRKFSRDLDHYADQIIDEHLIRKAKPEDPGYQNDFVDHLLQIQRENHFTRENIKTIITEMYFAATDMMAFTIEWAMSELVKNPNIMKTAQEEVRRVVGAKPIPKQGLDEGDIQEMSYLKCVVKETLRLHPSSGLFPLECSMNTTLNDYYIPAKTRVLINVWSIQRDSKLWDRPDEFVPERFFDNAVDFKGQDYEFIPFGSGRRGCPGMLFGVTVIESAIANLLYWFDWELPDGVDTLDMEEHIGVSLCRKTPLLVVPVRRR